MYERYREECNPGKDNLDGFAIYMKSHANDVYELIEYAMECEG